MKSPIHPFTRSTIRQPTSLEQRHVRSNVWAGALGDTEMHGTVSALEEFTKSTGKLQSSFYR